MKKIKEAIEKHQTYLEELFPPCVILAKVVILVIELF